MNVIRRVAIGAFLLVGLTAAPAIAQEASIVGSVADQTKAVLPGVSVTVTDIASGAQSVAVADERGEFRFPRLNPGVYKMQAELAGFSSVLIPKIELLVGQNATVPITLALSAVNESVTVSGEAPLVDTTSTQVAGNVNRTQMDAVPLLGRNWLELAKMVPGMTSNVITTSSPGVGANNWAMNLDGQQVANKTSQSLGQPKFSREAIAEYQIVTNLYDVTQGRSTGVQLQAITKSGTNLLSGSAYGFFRDDSLNAADAISHTVLPYKDQQFGGTLGGPVVKDKMHYFASYEYERTPLTNFDTVQVLGQSFTIPDKQRSSASLLRVDNELTSSDRLSVRGTYSTAEDPASLAAGTHPSQQAVVTQGSFNLLGTWSKVLSGTAVQEIKVGLKHFSFSYVPAIPGLVPEYDFPGLIIGPVNWQPQWHAQDFTQIRYDLNLHRGTHDLKLGGEFLNARMWDDYRVLERGQMTFTSLPSDMASRIPAATPLDPSTWNLTGLNSIAQRFNVNFPKTSFEWVTPDPEFALWIGDNWRIKNNLTLTYGLRYDNYWYGATASGITPNSIPISQYSSAVLPSANIPEMSPGDFGYRTGVHDNLDFGPQGGFAWNVGGSNDFVIHGGSGVYYSVYEKSNTKNQILTSNLFAAQFNNNGSNANFISNPTGGVSNYSQAILLTGIPQSGNISSGRLRMPSTWQSGLGFSKQLGASTGITADLVYRQTIHELVTIYPNLYYDPTTGYNVNPAKAVPNAGWGQIGYRTSNGQGQYTALQTSLNRRLWRRMQGGASYTLMLNYKDTAATANNPFDYLDAEYATSTSFQRSTLRGWTAYELPWGTSVSATYSYGSGNRYAATIAANPYGATVSNRLNLAAGGAAAAPIIVPASVLDRWDGPAIINSGVIIPRDALEGTPFSRLDFRVTKSVSLGPRAKAQLIAELFNALNYANYTNFQTSLSATAPTTTARFGQPSAADVGRQGQLAFRLTF